MRHTVKHKTMCQLAEVQLDSLDSTIVFIRHRFKQVSEISAAAASEPLSHGYFKSCR